MSTDWETLASWWDEKQGDEGDLWHRALITPPLFQLLGSVADQRVLDLACGNGYIARRLARQGACVTGVDASAAIIERARAWEADQPLGIVYHVADAARLDMLTVQAFDVVVCNMALMDLADAAGAIHEVARVLRPHGRFLASLAHPCFDVPNASAWAVEHMYYSTIIWRKVSRYRGVFDDTVPWNEWHIPRYHRPLSWYVRTLRAAGFVLTAFEEPEPTDAFLHVQPSGPWIAEIPLHCVIEAVLA